MEYNQNKLNYQDKRILSDENDYDCQGKCTCKFIKDRTNYDIMFFKHYEDDKKFNLPTYKDNNININQTKGWL